MEKIIVKQVSKEEITHQFYCDICNKHIGDSVRFEDGFYYELGGYEQNFNVKGFDWCELKMYLCDECQIKMTNHILQKLKELGFKVKEFGEYKEITLLGEEENER